MTPARCLTSVLLLALALSSSACLGSGNSVNVYGGKRTLEASDWSDVDNPTVYGADVVVKMNLPWLNFEGGYFHTEENGSDVGAITDADLGIDEYFVGLRVTPWKILIEPYGSIGVSYVDSQLDATGADDTDEVLAYYLRVGAAFTIGLFRLGLDGRALLGSDVTLDTIESDVDGYQFTAFVGVGF
jgi:hypothetical protein